MSSNLAILPEIFDQKMEFVEAEEQIVLIDPDLSGGWISEQIAIAKNLNDETLLWENKMYEPHFNEYTEKFNIKIG